MGKKEKDEEMSTTMDIDQLLAVMFQAVCIAYLINSFNHWMHINIYIFLYINTFLYLSIYIYIYTHIYAKNCNQINFDRDQFLQLLFVCISKM